MHKIPRHILSWTALLFLSVGGYTQSSSYCSNTAMVPVFKQTFDSSLSSSDVSMAPGGSTNYIWGNVGTDGRYIVTPRVENAGKGDWTKGGDHTGNSNGNMFLVNAGSNKSILLQQTVNNLCSGSSYSFSAWAANVNTSKTEDICGSGLRYPKLTFNIKTLSNVLLASYTTGNLPLSPDNGPVNWQKYGFQFDLPANTSSLRIEIVDAWGGGDACGNDLALDDILFEACIPQITVSLNSSNSNVCAGTSATIQSSLVNSPYTSPAYQWQKSTDGSTWSNLGSPVTGTGADLLNFPSTALADGGLYRVTVAPTVSSLDIATCSAHSNELSFTVNPLPQVAPASNGPLCSGKDLSLKANASGGSGSYTQFLWTGPASFQSVHADTLLPAVQTNANGNYTVKVTDSKGCSSSGNLSVQIDSTPIISISSITDTICSGTTGQINVNSSVPNSSFYWDATVVSGSVTGNTTTSNPDLSGIQQSTLYNNGTINSAIRYSVYALTTANCSSDTLQPSITVLPNPDTPNAGKDSAICNSAGFQLYGNTPVVGTGAWTQISGPNTAVFADSTLAHTAVSNLVPGTYYFVWRISNSCASNADTIMLYYKSPPAPAFVLSDTSICGPTSVSLTNNTPNKADYGFSWNFGNGTSSSFADPTAVVFASSVSGLDTTYTITLKAYTGCDTATITKTLLVKQKPRAGLTVIPENNCMPTTVQLINQSLGSSTTYRMVFGDGSDSIVLATDTILHVYNAASSTTFQPMIIATNSCGVDTAATSFIATADLLNIQTNLIDTAVCGNPFTANFTNNTTGATQFTWTWGDGTADYTSASASSVQHVYQDSGTYNIALRILHACGDTTISKTLHITAMPDTAYAGTDTTICNGAGFQLHGNVPAVGTGAWTQISGPNSAVFADSTLAHSPVSNLVPGTYHFVWRISNNCASSADTMMLYYKAPPAPAFVLSDTSICGPASVNFTNNTPNKADYGFSWNFGNGSNSSLADPSSVLFAPSVSGLDTSYSITLKAFTGCDTATINKIILVKQTPRAGLTVIPENTCMPTTVQLINQSLGSNTIYKLLFGDGGDTTIHENDTVLHVYNAASSTTFQPMIIATNSCGADTATASFLATADLLNIQTNLSDTAVCGNPFTANFTNNTTGATQFTWTWGDGTANYTSATAGNVQHVYQDSGTYTISLRILHACGDTTVSKTIHITAMPNTAVAGADTTICNSAGFQLYGNTPVVGTGAWTQISGPNTAVLTDSSVANTVVTNIIPGTYHFVWRISNNCASSADTMMLYYKASPAPAFVLSDTSICGPASVSFTNNTPNKADYGFSWNFGNGTCSSLADPSSVLFAPSVNGLDTTYTITLKAFTGCDTATITKTILVKQTPRTGLTVIPQNTCMPTTVQLINQSVGSNTIYKLLFGDGGDTTIHENDTVLHVYNAASSTTFQPMIIATNSCGADTATASFLATADLLNIQTNLSDTAVCGNPFTANFTNNTTGATQFTWTWGDGSADYTSASASSVQHVYQDSGTYNIALRILHACGDTTISKTIYVYPAVKSSFSISTSRICAGDSVQFLNQSDMSLQYFWKINNDTSHTFAPKHQFSLPGSYPSALFVSKAFPNLTCADSSQLTIIVDTVPVIQFNQVDDQICAGQVANIAINSSPSSVSYFWNNNSSNSSSIQHTTSSTARTMIEFRDSVYAVSANGCISNKLDTLITVQPLPDTAVAGIDTTICNSAGFQLYGNTPVVGTGAWMQISGPNTAVFADSTLAHTAVSNLVPGTYYFVWRISNSCASSADTMMLYYKAPPTPAFVLSDTSICGPASVNFTNNTPNKADYGFSWNFGNGSNSSLADPSSVLFAPSVSGLDTSYSITLKAFTACDTITITKTILIKQTPRAGLTVIPENNCMPTTVQLINQSLGSSTTYRMVFGDGTDSIVLATDTILHVYNAASSTTFQPMIIATNSCGADTATAVLQTIANPVNIRLNLQDTAVCGAPFELSFRNNSTGISQFNWNWGDGTNSTTSDTGIVHHKYLQPGIYKLTLLVSGVCGDTLIARNIHVYPAVKAAFDTISANNCIGDSIRFKSLSDKAMQLQWTINNNAAGNLQEFNFAFKQPGIFPVQLIASQENPLKTCSDTTSRNIRIIAVQPGKGGITPLYGNCVPFVVQLTNQTNQPTSSVQWLVSNGETTSGDSAAFTFNQSGTYKVIMQARNAGGCLFTDSATIQIKSPVGTIQYKGGAYCGPNIPISFTPEVSNTDSIEWNFGDGTILTTSVRTIKHQYKQQGIFRPVFTLISNTGCRIPIQNTDSIVIEIVKAGFNVNTVYECGTTTFNFKDSSTSLNGIRNHYWRVNSLPAGNGRSATASFKRKGAQLTELSVESNFGCTDNIRGAYNVEIYNFPQVNINSINEACMNNLMELKSNISSADSVIHRLWNLGNGQSATDSAVKVLYYDEGVYTVKLTASTVNTCYDSAIKQIAIHALPPISIAKEKNICAGDSIVLRVNGTANYVWKDQQNNLICNNCNTITVRPQESTQYQVIGYNEYGCSNVAATSVKVIAPAKIQVSPESVLCEGSSVRIWASGGSSYKWMPAPGLTNHNAAAPIVSPQVTTTYKVIGKDQYNCFTDTAFTRVVVGKPTPVSVGKDTSFIAGTKIRLRAEVATNNIVQWKWSGGADLSCVFCPEPIARVVNDEDIACSVTNEFGCITSDTLKIRTFCPGAEVFIPNAFSPDGDGRNDWLYVQAKGIKLVKNFRVYSRWGELVFEKNNFLPNDQTAGWNGRIRGNLANPDIYVYVCEVICEKGAPQLYKGNVAILK